MENDDPPVGQILSRRDALKILGVGGAAFLAAYAAPQSNEMFATALGVNSSLDCVVRPELTIGQDFVDNQLNRSDIRSEPKDHSIKEGVFLTLNIIVSSVGNHSCTPIQGAQVDVWQCDALGHYSGVTDTAFDTTGLKFLRGYQLTNANGAVQFQTIYPGWYSGRAVHIHFMIRTKGANHQSYQFTSQLFFDDLLTDRVHTLKPYSEKSQRNTRNVDDAFFIEGGQHLLLYLQGNTTHGFTGTINIGLDLTNTKVDAADIGTAGPHATTP